MYNELVQNKTKLHYRFPFHNLFLSSKLIHNISLCVPSTHWGPVTHIFVCHHWFIQQFVPCLVWNTPVLTCRYIDSHDDVIRWNHFPRYWPFVRGIHRSPLNSPHKGQWRWAMRFSLICVWINGWQNNREAGDLRRYRAHYDVIVIWWTYFSQMSVIMSGPTVWKPYKIY